MLQLNKLTSLTKKRKRIGRGGSRGGTSGRGHKGQKSRSGSHTLKPFFEGGQMPLPRRLPRRGFTNAFRTECKIITLEQLQEKFNENDVVTAGALRSKGLLKGKKVVPVKILGTGTLSKALTIQLDAVSKSAQEAIAKAGGTVQLIGERDRGSITE